MNNSALSWWSFLCGVSAINVIAWVASTLFLHKRRGPLLLGTWSTTHWHVVLSAAYVLGCAYRSFFPVFDVQRLVMVDSWLSSVVVGRTVATIAELCFAAQWALLLQTVAQACGSPFAAKVARWIVPQIVVAEFCCWIAVLSTSNLGHVFEASLWGLSAFTLVASFVALWPRCVRAHRPLIAMATTLGLTYVVYMFAVDVPMYWARWVFDEGRGHQYLSFAQGLADVSGRWVVSQRWEDWKSEVVWMSIYFSAAVWLSIGLVHASHSLGNSQKTDRLDQADSPTARKPIWFKNPQFH
jgi:hypothetical protein